MSLDTIELYGTAKKVVQELAGVKKGDGVCIVADTRNTNIADA